MAVWARRDPHARAYQTLLTDQSRRIVHNLGQGSAESNTLCLACHSSGANETHSATRADGVGCERCHGAAENWLSDHYLPGWHALSPPERAGRGFRETKDLVTQARGCVVCHVGTPAADVDHDLIAAGHPPLRFEFSSYLAIYPKHWNGPAAKRRTPDLEVRAWKIGQLVSATAAVRLLQHRATKGTVWPEFAEYGCYACHHDLQAARSPRTKKPAADLYAWGAWYLSEIPAAVSELPVAQQAELLRRLDMLRQVIATPLPDRQRAGRLALELRKHLDDATADIANLSEDATALGSRWRKFQTSSTPSESWEAATQRFLARAAVHHGLFDVAPTKVDPSWLAELQATAEQLRHHSRSDGPQAGWRQKP